MRIDLPEHDHTSYVRNLERAVDQVIHGGSRQWYGAVYVLRSADMDALRKAREVGR